MPIADVVVAGHICLDIIPTLETQTGTLAALLQPGNLVRIGPAQVSTGGAVSNTGQALHRLGVPVRLMGKIGDDLFGETIRAVVGRLDPALAEGLLVAAGEPSSYTIVLSAPGMDRRFLHCPGVNDSFSAADVPYDELAAARLFHFGYPPIMRRMYADGAAELERLLRNVHARGVTTSLDMARLDPASDAGRVDWRAVLERVLPHVDLFVPSIDELLYMVDRPAFERLFGAESGGQSAALDPALLRRVAEQMLACGAAVVLLKLGEQGVYLRTAARAERLSPLARAGVTDVSAWCDRELLTPCFRVNVIGTTGSGDCAIAGFLAGLRFGLTPEAALVAAAASGACCVEQPDATSGVVSWAAMQARVAGGWPRHAPVDLPGWAWDAGLGVSRGPADRRS